MRSAASPTCGPSGWSAARATSRPALAARAQSLAIGAGLPTDPRVTVGSGGDPSNRVIISKQGGDIINIDAPPGFPGSGMFYWRELLE